MPLGRGAIPRSIMAFIPRSQLLPLVAQNLTELTAVGLGATVDEVVEALRTMRKAGYFVAYGEVTPGAVGIAAPIFDLRNYPIASLCVTIAGSAISSNAIARIGADVRQAAAEMTELQAELATADDL